MPATGGRICGAGVVVIIYLVSVIMFACSFSALTPIEAGLRRSTYGSLDRSRIYHPGRYFVDITHSFIRYPLTLQTVKFGTDKDADRPPLLAAVAGGQQVSFSCSFQYRLMLHTLVDLNTAYVQSYETQYISIAQETIQNIIKQYPSEAIYQERILIGNVLQAALNERLQQKFAVVEHFQILTVQPPAKIAAKILQRIITQEQINTQTISKQSSVLLTNISVINSNAQLKARVYQSNANLASSNLLAEGEALAIGIRLNATANAYNTLKTGLNLTNDELVQFLFLDHIRTLGGSASMAIGLPTAFVSM